MLQVGINTNNKCGNNDIEILNNIAKTNFKNIMLSFKSKNINESIKIIKDLGLNISYFHIDNKNADNLWAKGKSVNKYINEVTNQLEICGKNNIPIAVMHATCGNPCGFALKPNKEGLTNLKKLLEIAKKNNVKIALENVDKYALKHLYYLLNNIQDDNLGFCYDVGHHQLYNPKAKLLKKYANRLFAVHLHDNLMDWQPGYDYTKDIHLLPFDGRINYDKVCSELKKVNYNGIVMLEIHKKICGKSLLYENINDVDLLKEAYTRAKKIAKLIEE